MYIKEEVQAEELVRQIGDFARFLEVASFSYSSLWTSTDIGREANVKRATVDNYLQILEDLVLAFSIPIFSRRAKRRLVAHPKIYFFDVGIYHALRPRGILDNACEIEGGALEGLVAQHLYSWVQAQPEPHTLSFWCTSTKLEVDFVIYGPKGFWAIKVKRSNNLGPDDIRDLAVIKEDYPEAQAFILTLGKRQEIYRGFPIIPVEDFLKQLTPEDSIYSA